MAGSEGVHRAEREGERTRQETMKIVTVRHKKNLVKAVLFVFIGAVIIGFVECFFGVEIGDILEAIALMYIAWKIWPLWHEVHDYRE